MTESELTDIIVQGENEYVEFKEAWPSGDTTSRVIVGLANTHGGSILIVLFLLYL